MLKEILEIDLKNINIEIEYIKGDLTYLQESGRKTIYEGITKDHLVAFLSSAMDRRDKVLKELAKVG